jgi:hypothetical protein
VKAKIWLEELGLKGLKWDVPDTGSDRECWEQFFGAMEQLQKIEFSRCIFAHKENIFRTKLDNFVDASE